MRSRCLQGSQALKRTRQLLAGPEVEVDRPCRIIGGGGHALSLVAATGAEVTHT